MSYKYRYQFTVEGLNKQTKELETLCVMSQDRNVGIDHELYKNIRRECYNFSETHSSVNVTIVRWDLRYPVDSLEFIQSRYFVGMFFFDKYDTFTHRSIIISRPDGEKVYWSTFAWKD